MRSSVVQEVQFPQQPALQLIYDTAPIGLAYLSPDCHYLQINQRLTEICGISVEGHLGRTVRDCVPALASSVEAIVRSIMETGEPVTGIEVYGQRPGHNDERCWITYWHPQLGPNGNIVGVNVAAEEITERKRSEREIRAARDAAEAALHHLQETQASLIEAEKLAALGRLVAGRRARDQQPCRHQPDGRLGAGAQMRRLRRRSRARQVEAIQPERFPRGRGDASALLVGNLNRAAELVAIVQAGRGRSEAIWTSASFDPGDFTEQVMTSLRPALPKNNLTLKVDCEPDLAMNSYPGPYGQVMTNLFLNSVAHAFPDGKGGEIDIRVRAYGADHVEILFSDDGCGMSPEVRRQAFDPFFTTRRDGGRIGLGLHIVHNIVTNRLGGRLELESEPGKGTKIRIVLPRIAPGRVAGA